MNVYSNILQQQAQGRRQFAVLIDPETRNEDSFIRTARAATEAGVDFLFIGGSLLSNDNMNVCLDQLRKETRIPLVLFPGSPLQVNPSADAILLLSLISGRNPDLLIGSHVIAAPYLKQSGLEIIPTGYMLIESGISTTALYMSHTLPIPGHKPDIAACTALAGEMLGLKLIYLDAGSGALRPVSAEMIQAVRQNTTVPLVVGGGITHPEMARKAVLSGANIVVVGNAIEKDSGLIQEMAHAIHSV